MNYQKMSRMAADPAAVRQEAKLLAELLGERATAWQSRFLNRLMKFEGPDILPMDDREDLWKLMGKASRREERGGYRAATLVEKLWHLRSDLPEEDEEFITGLHLEGRTCAPTNAQWEKIFILARNAGEIDHWVV
ncbi:MAG: hypothetical protein ACR2OX_01205 [Methyloligellaceae bacterium]